jgi:hypothetical protein
MAETKFDPSSLVRVKTVADIENLAKETLGIFVFELNDEKLFAVTQRLPGLRHLVSDGNTQVTDHGVEHLKEFSALESLDLEWSNVTDAGLQGIAAVKSLRWVDLSYCKGVSPQGAAELQRMRPDLEAIFTWP